MSTEFAILLGVYLLWDTTYVGRQYLTTWNDDIDVDNNQENSYKQLNKHKEMAYLLVCWERHTYFITQHLLWVLETIC